MLPRCKTCKFYYDDSCTRIDPLYKRFYGPETADSLTVVVISADDHGLDCSVYVGPDFGCVHHEIKQLKSKLKGK